MKNWIVILITLLLFMGILPGCRRKVVERYPNGNKKSVYYVKLFSKDIIDGPDKEYYENGNLKIEQAFINGKIQGIQKVYFLSGKLKRKHLVKDSKPYGYDSVWYENGKLKHIGLYKEGKKNGKWIFYDSSGSLEEECYYNDNLVEGKRVKYYENGKINEIHNLRKDYPYGKYIKYYRNGKIELIIYEYNCIPCDTMFSYDSTGVLKSKIIFDIDCDSVIKNKIDSTIYVNKYKYNKKGEIIKRKSFTLDGDSLEQKSFRDRLKYFVEIIKRNR